MYRIDCGSQLKSETMESNTSWPDGLLFVVGGFVGIEEVAGVIVAAGTDEADGGGCSPTMTEYYAMTGEEASTAGLSMIQRETKA